MKKTIHSTSNNLLIKERKKENKGLHKCTQKLHENISSNPNFSYKSIGDTDNDIKVQIKVRNQGIQTLDTQEIDDLFSEGIVKYVYLYILFRVILFSIFVYRSLSLLLLL